MPNEYNQINKKEIAQLKNEIDATAKAISEAFFSGRKDFKFKILIWRGHMDAVYDNLNKIVNSQNNVSSSLSVNKQPEPAQEITKLVAQVNSQLKTIAGEMAQLDKVSGDFASIGAVTEAMDVARVYDLMTKVHNTASGIITEISPEVNFSDKKDDKDNKLDQKKESFSFAKNAMNTLLEKISNISQSEHQSPEYKVFAEHLEKQAENAVAEMQKGLSDNDILEKIHRPLLQEIEEFNKINRVLSCISADDKNPERSAAIAKLKDKILPNGMPNQLGDLKKIASDLTSFSKFDKLARAALGVREDYQQKNKWNLSAGKIGKIGNVDPERMMAIQKIEDTVNAAYKAYANGEKTADVVLGELESVIAKTKQDVLRAHTRQHQWIPDRFRSRSDLADTIEEARKKANASDGKTTDNSENATKSEVVDEADSARSKPGF